MAATSDSARIAVLVLSLLLAFAPARLPAQQGQTIELTPQDVERLRAYHERIAGVAAPLPSRTSLAAVIGPVMTLASERSTGGDPIAENRSAILMLAFYATGRDLGRLVPEARDWSRAPRRRLMLHGRGDLMQHFTISAALSAAAGAPLANIIGIYKEIEDARRGSGFSFADLAADRAGTTFGQLATESPEQARLFQSRITPRLRERDLIPSIDGLPEGLRQDEFTRRYRGENAGEYDALVAEIDRRIGGLALYERLSGFRVPGSGFRVRGFGVPGSLAANR